MRLSTRTAELHLGNLHLRTRALNALRQVRVTTIGDFFNHPKIEGKATWRIGPATWLEIKEARRALSSAITDDGGVNWLTYAQMRQFTILPPAVLLHWSGRQFMKRFPAVARIAVESRFGRAGLVVFEERLLKPSNQRQTLDRVALKLGVIWETVRKLEIDIVSMFRHICLDDDYSRCQFRFRSEFLEPIRLLATSFKYDSNTIRSFDDCEQIFKRIWGVTFNQLGGQQNVLLEMFGFRRLHLQEPTYLHGPRTGTTRLRATRKEIRKVLAAGPLSNKDLARLLRTKLGPEAPSNKELARIISKMPRGKQRANIRGRPAEKPSADWITNTCERLLRRRRKPLHFSELCTGVNRSGRFKLRLSPRLVAVYLHRDARFVPISWSGFWALAEWPDVETRRITDVAEAVLIATQEPLSDEVLFERIAERRPVGRKSVTPMLNKDKRFRRMEGGLWSLAKKEGALNRPAAIKR